MGYSHYWTMKKSTQKNMQLVTDAAKAICEAAGIPLTGWNEEGETDYPIYAKPTLAEKLAAAGSDSPARTSWIVLNGLADDAHETFCWGEKGWDFCKTAQKPYDLVVTAILCCAAHLGCSKVSSDGGPEDWAEGLALARRVLVVENAPTSVWYGLAVPDLEAGSR